MASKYLENIKHYQPNVNDGAVAGIVKHLGIALKSPDASKVSCSSKEELVRVRESWLKKKLGVVEEDEKLDRAIAEVCATIKGDAKKDRVTFYYLLAEKYGKLNSLAS
ncbi:MAG: DUF2853 family protein [Hyphomicrobium sp.]